jgi:hypothetical protein
MEKAGHGGPGLSFQQQWEGNVKIGGSQSRPSWAKSETPISKITRVKSLEV